MLKEKNCQTRIFDTAKISFRNEGKIRTFSDEGKLGEFAASITTLTELLKFLKCKENDIRRNLGLSRRKEQWKEEKDG